MKPKNPYQRLLDEVKDWYQKTKYRHEKKMWLYPKDRLDEGWALRGLYERTQAAQQLGYDVQLIADDTGLSVLYKKQIPTVPYLWQ